MKRKTSGTVKTLPPSPSPQKTYDKLKKAYPMWQTELTYEGPFQLLIAVILSAQCTDERVNQVTPHLFRAFPDAKSLAQAPQKKVETLIHSCGFYQNKARAIIDCARSIVKVHGGQVPQTMEELTDLSGVGRKTASVILSQAFGVPAIAVDTHVKRVAYRLGWTTELSPEKVEKDLMRLFPQRRWSRINMMLILHGRRLCKARKPLCSECFIHKECPAIGVELQKKAKPKLKR